MLISKICITGGPCAGKTTIINLIRKKLVILGYSVSVIEEAATTLFSQGILTGNESDIEIASKIVKYQLKQENDIAKLALRSRHPVIILCDRSAIEPAAYIGIDKLNAILFKNGQNFYQLRNSYDLVIHLNTTAKGAEDFYTLENNEARTESINEARDLDDKLLQIWEGHPNRVILNNNCSFSEKAEKAISLVTDHIQKMRNMDSREDR